MTRRVFVFVDGGTELQSTRTTVRCTTVKPFFVTVPSFQLSAVLCFVYCVSS